MLVCFLCDYLCEKYYKPVTVQYCTDNCVNWVPKLTLLYLLFCSVAQSCPTLCQPMGCSTPGFPVLTISRSLLKLMTIDLVKPSNHLILCRPLLLLPSVFPSFRVFSNESALCVRVPGLTLLDFQINWTYKGALRIPLCVGDWNHARRKEVHIYIQWSNIETKEETPKAVHQPQGGWRAWVPQQTFT